MIRDEQVHLQDKHKVVEQVISNNKQIELKDFITAVLQGKWLIVVIASFLTVAAVFYAISLPNIYRADVLVSPAQEDSSLKMPGQLGGLAALAGVNLGGSGGNDKITVAVELLKSRAFIGSYIQRNDILVSLMAAKNWDKSNQRLIIDESLFDLNDNEWKENSIYRFGSKPTDFEAYEQFLKILSVSEDKTTGMYRISIEHMSPVLAKKWLELLIKDINRTMRDNALAEAELSITYLKKQIENTQLAEMQSMLYSLIEEQMKIILLANVRDEYVFKIIDPAVIPEEKAKPKRFLIVLSAFIFGLFVSMFIVFVRYVRTLN